MDFARGVLVLSALPFAGIGIAFLASPHVMASYIGISSSGPTAAADLRAVYGGLQLGAAAWLLYTAQSPVRYRMGLIAQLCLYGGLAGARFLSYGIDGLPAGLALTLHAGELIALGAGVFALRRSSPPLAG